MVRYIIIGEREGFNSMYWTGNGYTFDRSKSFCHNSRDMAIISAKYANMERPQYVFRVVEI